MEHAALFGQIYVQLAYAVMFLLSRVVIHQGMSQYLFVFYRQCFASLAISLILFFVEGGYWVKPTLRDAGKISVLALLGVTVSQNLYYSGLSLTSTTFATAMNNISPACTFLMALVLKMEKLDLLNWGGRAKILGTAICVGGAIFMTLFKGPVIGLQIPRSESSDWILGAFLLVSGVCAWSLCLIYQAWITLDCSSQMTSTAVMCWMGTIQSGLFALLFVRTPGAWRLNWDLELFTITYSGIFCSAIGLFVLLWCVKKKGPLFVSIFSPLSNVIVAILEPVLLHVPLRWGSFTGMVLVIGGLYCVLWGKAAEEQATREHIVLSCGARGQPTEPLLNSESGGAESEAER